VKRCRLEQADKAQYVLDEDGSARFVCISGVKGAELQITYKGAQASRPADMVDVEEFVGVKSCKAKGKRLTTFDVDTLTFIEPEVVEPEVVEPDEPESGDEPIDDDVEPMVEPIEEVSEEEVAEIVKPVNNSGTPIEIVRNDIDESNSEQLNLF